MPGMEARSCLFLACCLESEAFHVEDLPLENMITTWNTTCLIFTFSIGKLVHIKPYLIKSGFNHGE